MKRIILPLLLFVSCAYFAGCASSNPTSVAIENKYREGGGTVINISELTDFKWDKLYIFGPYAYDEFIQKIVGEDFFTPQEKKKLEFGLSEVDSMFVFTNKGKVVEHFIFSIIPADFTIFDGFNDVKAEPDKYDKNSFAYIYRDKYACFNPSNAAFKREGNKLVL